MYFFLSDSWQTSFSEFIGSNILRIGKMSNHQRIKWSIAISDFFCLTPHRHAFKILQNFNWFQFDAEKLFSTCFSLLLATSFCIHWIPFTFQPYHRIFSVRKFQKVIGSVFISKSRLPPFDFSIKKFQSARELICSCSFFLFLLITGILVAPCILISIWMWLKYFINKRI